MNEHEKVVGWEAPLNHNVSYANAPWKATVTLRKGRQVIGSFACIACCPVHLNEEMAECFSRLAKELTNDSQPDLPKNP